MRVAPLVNNEGELVALRQAWRFDPFYSLLLIEELEAGGSEAEFQQRLDDLIQDIVTNLRQFSFYTQVQLEGRSLDFAQVKDYNLMEIHQRIEFSFILPLAEPVALQGQELNYQIYDPSYYIEMLHRQEEGIDTSQLPESCELDLHQAQPSDEVLEEALALDKDETPEDPQLGRYFAETVTLNCPSV